MRRTSTKRRVVLVVALLLCLALAANLLPTPLGLPTSRAAIYTVNATDDNDDGTCDASHCSLREAILAANANAGPDTIAFNISGTGVQTITPGSPLPYFTGPVTIDGLTQPGASCSSWPPTLLIEISGSSGGYAHGLWFFTGNSTVQGLIINSFQRDGLRFEESGGSTVVCNFIGTDATGTADRGNGTNGLSLIGSANNTVGGTTPGTRNLISGNNLHGVSIEWGSATGNVVQGNYIGTNAAGTGALGNGTSTAGSGVNLQDSAHHNTIGPGNLISGNAWYGVRLYGSGVTGNVVQGNSIGTGINGTENLGNGGSGVNIHGEAHDNIVGGTASGQANLIMHNGTSSSDEDGVWVGSGSGNLISGNRIFANAGLGIDLGANGVTPNDPGDTDTGANNLQNFPIITSVTINNDGTTIHGSLNSTPNTNFTIEFFYSTSQDPTGYGEGEHYLGSHPVTTDDTGNTTFSVTFPTQAPSGFWISATATDPNNNTSEFSASYGAPTAVVLANLVAHAQSGQIVVEWQTLSEFNAAGFHVYRSTAYGQYIRLNAALIQAQGGPTWGATYTFNDTDVIRGMNYYYMLEDVDVRGTSTRHGPVSATVPAYSLYLPLVCR